MSAVSAQPAHTYAVHGVAVHIRCDDPAVLRCLDLRFRAPQPAPSDAGQVTLEYVSSPGADAAPTGGRTVYETPFGSLAYHPAHDLITGALGGVQVRCAPGRGHARISAPLFRERALYFATHPVTTVVLMELMERFERFSLHAGCLADETGRGLLVAGSSGAGKSTLTLALARAGLEFLGDDLVFLAPSAGPPVRVRALGFPDALGLSPFAASRFPELAARAAPSPPDGFPKRLQRFEELFDRPPRAGCRPEVIVFPEVAPTRPSSLEPLAGGEALVRLVPDVLVTHEPSTRAHIQAIAALIEQARCYRLRSGHDLERAAELALGRLGAAPG